MTDIREGTIGVNTASDTGELLEVIEAGELIYCRPLGSANFTEYVPAAHFWPLISKLNIGE